MPKNQFKIKNPKRPHITLLAYELPALTIVAFFADHFGRNVIGRAAQLEIVFLVGFGYVAETEVDEAN